MTAQEDFRRFNLCGTLSSLLGLDVVAYQAYASRFPVGEILLAFDVGLLAIHSPDVGGALGGGWFERHGKDAGCVVYYPSGLPQLFEQ